MNQEGAQRLSLQQLQAWEALGYGMFIHFGMSTFDGNELSDGTAASTLYAPDQLDVDQWLRVAHDAGMRYAVLTAKHVSGHCLWPTQYNDYNITNSGNPTDVVAAFVAACRKYGLMPGLYYCSWDNHNTFGSVTPSVDRPNAYTTQAYQAFQWDQLTELLTQYGSIGEVWIDIPFVLPRDYRNRLYAHCADLQPDAIILMNNGVTNGTSINIPRSWPTDVLTIERYLPSSRTGYVPWHEVHGQRYYVPGEVCDPIGREWFFVEGDEPRSDAELLGMLLTCRSRGANMLLNVPPDKTGQIPTMYVDALMRLRDHLDRLQLI